MHWNIEIMGGGPALPLSGNLAGSLLTYACSLPDRPALAGQPMLFKGSAASPLLAPRAVWSAAGRLLVSDTAQNRVFVWHRLPTHENTPPDLVLGQSEATGTGRNAGSRVSGSTLHYPSGIWSDGQRLAVADAWNHRVLIWHNFPVSDGQEADVVLGQPGFSNNQPNVSGIGAAPKANSLHWPYGVYSDGQRLWVADTGNRRVLYFEKFPDTSFAPADAVIGQPDFHSRDYDHHGAVWPYSVRVSAEGALCITDVQYFRTLLWKHWEKAPHMPATAIIGQDSFGANGMNRFSPTPRADGLNWVYDACFYKKGLFVADTGNSRLLWFSQLPQTHAVPADNLIGHASFETGSENANSKLGTAHQLYWPFSVCIADDRLFVADTGNHRLLVYPLLF